jgi:hypothetical protein
MQYDFVNDSGRRRLSVLSRYPTPRKFNLEPVLQGYTAVTHPTKTGSSTTKM